MINVLTNYDAVRYTIKTVSQFYGYNQGLDVDFFNSKLWQKMTHWLSLNGANDAVLLMVADQNKAKYRMELMEKIEKSLLPGKDGRKIHFNAVFLSGHTEQENGDQVYGSIDEYFVFLEKYKVSGKYTSDFEFFAKNPIAPPNDTGISPKPLSEYRIVNQSSGEAQPEYNEDRILDSKIEETPSVVEINQSVKGAIKVFDPKKGDWISPQEAGKYAV